MNSHHFGNFDPQTGSPSTSNKNPDPDPHQSDKLDPKTDPDPPKFANEKP
jgi:hypothetical protein